MHEGLPFRADGPPANRPRGRADEHRGDGREPGHPGERANRDGDREDDGHRAGIDVLRAPANRHGCVLYRNAPCTGGVLRSSAFGPAVFSSRGKSPGVAPRPARRPDGKARRPRTGAPAARSLRGGVAISGIFERGATQPARDPQRGSRVGVERGCIAGRTGSPARQPRWGPRMQPDFHRGLLNCSSGRAPEPARDRTLFLTVLRLLGIACTSSGR